MVGTFTAPPSLAACSSQPDASSVPAAFSVRRATLAALLLAPRHTPPRMPCPTPSSSRFYARASSSDILLFSECAMNDVTNLPNHRRGVGLVFGDCQHSAQRLLENVALQAQVSEDRIAFERDA